MNSPSTLKLSPLQSSPSFFHLFPLKFMFSCFYPQSLLTAASTYIWVMEHLLEHGQSLNEHILEEKCLFSSSHQLQRESQFWVRVPCFPYSQWQFFWLLLADLTYVSKAVVNSSVLLSCHDWHVVFIANIPLSPAF